MSGVDRAASVFGVAIALLFFSVALAWCQWSSPAEAAKQEGLLKIDRRAKYESPWVQREAARYKELVRRSR